ncbi:MAG: nitrite reductase small subunit NirD [Saprospiraceae bacterium]|nr:nitrite reductase small subunit NirD [Saprospiraceae bacterium]
MEALLAQYTSVDLSSVTNWYEVAPVNQFPKNGGVCVKYKGMQIAVFYFARQGRWYACQNLCPHKLEMVLSRGLLGEENGVPKVACALHKKTFSLETGENLNGDLPPIATYPVKVQGEKVFIGFKE